VARIRIFPDLASANTAYKLLATIGGAETTGQSAVYATPENGLPGSLGHRCDVRQG
jgi:hypothetical protein